MSKNHKNIAKPGRRKFIRQASCAALGYTSLFSTLNSLKAANAAAISNSATLDGTYKAMVCLMFSGGNDSFNMLVPAGAAEYGVYANTRSNQAIPQADLLPINPITSNGGQSFGLHPSLTDVQTMFEGGDVAFIANVGSLIEPTTKTQYENGGTSLPLGLYSHSDQAMHWQTALPQDRASIGWGGKLADMVSSQNSNQSISMNISLAGSNVFQVGNNAIEYAIDPYDGSYGITGYDDPWLFGQLRKAAIDSMLAKNYQDVFKKSYMNTLGTAKAGHEQFSAAIGGVTPFNTLFTDNDLSQSFHMIAKTIAARDTLGVSRQIFFVDYGGWDHHDEVLINQENMFAEVNAALKEFSDAMAEINMSDCVTTFTMSEFGRTLTSNGNGTDHAWGGNVMVMGGAVKGQDIYGSYPTLALDSDLEIGGGTLIPTTGADEYFAELSHWFGVSKTDLPIILPNIGNFYNINGSPPPMGFMTL